MGMSEYRRRLLGNKNCLITTIRLNQNLTDPSSMITRIVDGGGIEAIRANSHRYTGYLDGDTMMLKQLDDNNGTKYVDGTTAPLTTLGTDVWMKLPLFYYKAVESSSDIWDISFVYGDKPDSTYKEWEGDDLIGVYTCTISSSKMYSVGSGTPTGNRTIALFKTYASNRGSDYRVVHWRHLCIMAFLFYAYYGTTDSSRTVGMGRTASYGETSLGGCSSLGMRDTLYNGTHGTSINFWGLEDWWGSMNELADGVTVSEDIFTITNYDGTTRKITSNPDSPDVGALLALKMYIGEYLDLVPTKTMFSGNITGFETTSYIQGYCDYWWHQTSGTHGILSRAAGGHYGAGIAAMSTDLSLSFVSGYAGSRLTYKGKYKIIE